MHTLKVNSLTDDYDYDYDWDKVKVFCNTFIRLRERFCRDFVYYEDGKRYQGLPLNDYSYELFGDYYYRFWRCYHSFIMRNQYEDIIDERDIPYLFENWNEVYTKNIRSDILTLVNPNDIHFSKIFLTEEEQHIPRVFDGFLSNPSLFERNVNMSLKLHRDFDSRYKRRKLVNRVMVENKFNV